MSIAGVVLTLNEESSISRALSSLTWCDELVVLDSGSKDKTEIISRQHNAQFFTHIQDPPFLITTQRNWALQNCGIKSEWVLFLDADEAIGDQLKTEILDVISDQKLYNSFELTPRYWFLGRWLKRTQGYPNWHPRLLKRNSVLFEGGVWESLSAEAVVGRITTPYEHYAFSKGLDDWILRHLRYSTWDARQIENFLNHSPLSTERKKRLRQLDSLLWRLKPLTRFTYKYFYCLGWTEGWQSLLYCLLTAFYDLMTVIKIVETRRKRSGLPL